MAATQHEDKSVTRFREYLRIKSVHPTPDYEGVVVFLRKLADQYQLDFKRIENDGKPIVLLTWKGLDPSLPSLLLNSHSDVVPVDQTKWKCDAFEAYKDEQGNIFARGTQDMKCVGIQYLEAIDRLKNQLHFQPVRTIHLLYVPEEEVGGRDGMEKFVETEEFRSLNIAFALDEGLASPDESFTVFYGERAAWWVRIKTTGPTGHGSRFVENNAMEKLIRIANKFLAFRKEQFETLQRGHHECGMKLGDVTTLNLTALKGGVTSDGGHTFQLNVVPGEAEAGFDIRIPPSVDLNVFRKQLEEWIYSEGEGVSYYFVAAHMKNTSTSLNEDENSWWKLFKASLEKQNLKLDTQIFPAATDSRFIRNKGIPALGFSPINNTPILLHDHNEFLNERVYLRGVDIYVQLIRDLTSVKF